MAEQSFHQSQSLHLHQTIAPQMQQSLQILQVPTLELRNLIQQELEANPVLEDETKEVSLDEQPTPEDDNFDDEFAQLSRMDDEWREYLSQSRTNRPRRDDDDERRQFLLDSLVSEKTLQDHLLDQLSLSDADDRTRELSTMLIGNTNDHGFLQTAVEELCFTAGIPLRDLEAAKELVQSFDPVGVCAEDLRECLLIQLDRLDKHHSLEYRIVDKHLDDLAKKRYPLIARKLNVTPEQISRAAEFIATLDPKPGSRFQSGINNYITPDVVVEMIGGEYLVTTNNDSIPRLRISNAYKELMAQGNSGQDVRSYIRDKIRNGKFLIRSIHQRQQTIENIAREIVTRQQAFLEHGPSQLKPMNMAQVADAVGVHETTVSRAISGKYIATPHGVYEMKYFFTPGYQTESGESMSNTSVKNALADLVGKEDSHRPYSDQKIVEELKKKGISIARRTVAKYRDELNILPSHMRKTY